MRALPGVSDVLVPQDVDYPALKLDIDRERASELGLTAKEVVDSLITALTSDGMIAPSYWVDPKTGNDYLLTVQYPENVSEELWPTLAPCRCARPGLKESNAAGLRRPLSPHPSARPKWTITNSAASMDVYVAPSGEDLSRVYAGVQKIIDETKLPENMRINVRGSVQAMRASFQSFGLGLILSTLLVYLILVAQFQSFLDPLLILLAVPTGLTGVLLILWLGGGTLNVMSLMGVVMMVGIVVSNSILIVDFTRRLRAEGQDRSARPWRWPAACGCGPS